MKFNLNTHDIQKMVIALINSKCCVTDTSLTKEDYDRLIDRLAEINRLCTAENDYTLSVTVEA